VGTALDVGGLLRVVPIALSTRCLDATWLLCQYKTRRGDAQWSTTQEVLALRAGPEDGGDQGREESPSTVLAFGGWIVPVGRAECGIQESWVHD
jgi:hypothetical protein